MHACLEAGNDAHECAAEHDRGVALGQDGHQRIPLRASQGERQQHNWWPAATHPIADPGDLAVTLGEVGRLERLAPRQIGQEGEQNGFDLSLALGDGI